MRAVILVAAAALLLAVPSWSRLKGRAANFQGLIMGKSKHAESLRVLGAPIYAGPPEGAPQIIADNYERPGLFPFPYQRVVIFWSPRTGIVGGGSAELYLSPKGEFSTWENLAKGLTYWPTPPSFYYSGHVR